MSRLFVALLCASVLVSLDHDVSARETRAPRADPGGDATVIAVIDSAFTPYHWDFLASKMPQSLDGDRSNDVPLQRAPHRWLKGFPDPRRAFESYQSFRLTLEEKDPERQIRDLEEADEKKWEDIRRSGPNELHYYWFPETKIIGALDFGGNRIRGRSTDHGTGTTSVSVGNLHGTCPECLLLFISYRTSQDAEAAINWAMRQPWIDAISNSYGFSTGYRDRIYAGSNTGLQRKASGRGQTIFFSAGNGQANTFTVPNTTYFSSQEGPDWIVTVGAVSPGTHASYSGHGKPADIAGIGSRYPAAYGSPTVGGTGGGFGGTSNATPTIAGLYARALYMARLDLAGPSRRQTAGVIARGPRFDCALRRPRCELGDGALTVEELRRRLFFGAVHSEAGTTVSSFGVGNVGPFGEDEFLNEGHGSYYAREGGSGDRWLDEFDRILGPMEGRAREIKRPNGEREWMIVDSYCRQHLWGYWKGGYYVRGKTKLPEDDRRYPVRSALADNCESLPTPPGA